MQFRPCADANWDSRDEWKVKLKREVELFQCGGLLFHAAAWNCFVLYYISLTFSGKTANIKVKNCRFIKTSKVHNWHIWKQQKFVLSRQGPWIQEPWYNKNCVLYPRPLTRQKEFLLFYMCQLWALHVFFVFIKPQFYYIYFQLGWLFVYERTKKRVQKWS